MYLKTKIQIIKLSNAQDLPLPAYATEQSAGMDLYAAINNAITIKSGAIQLISSGIAIALPQGFEAQIRPRSGLAAKHGITVLNSPGTIDADYRGEIKVVLINHSSEDFIITRAMKIAQMIITKHEIAKWEEVQTLDYTRRGNGGFGSTGYK